MLINWKRAFQFTCSGMQAIPGRWFFCFGTLLTLIRDKGVFPESADIDLGVFFDEYEPQHVETVLRSVNFIKKHQIVDDVSGKPLYMAFQSDHPDCEGLNLDIFAWRRQGDIYYHTYDTLFEKKDIPSTYVFKGTPAWIFDKGFHRMQQIGGSMMEGWVPSRYGTLLDLWYPDWIVPRNDISKTEIRKECKSCSELFTQ